MAGKGAAAGSTFLAGVLAKLSPEDRQKGEEALKVFQALGGGSVLEAIGDGTLAQAEFSRLSDGLKTQAEELTTRATELDQREAGLTQWHTDLTDWHAKAKEKFKAAPVDDPTKGKKPEEAVVPAGMLTEKDYNDRIQHERAAVLGFTRDTNDVMRDHFAKFGEIVAIEPLITHPRVAELGLKGVYNLVHKDRLEAFDKDKAAKAEAAIRLDERQKVQASMAQMPYPSPTGVGSGSPLDALKPANAEPVVDAAVAHYNRIVAERGAAS